MANIAALGIQIDSSGAKRGAEETKAAMTSMGAAADRWAAQHAAAIKAVNRQLQEGTAAHRALLGAMQQNTASIDKQTAALVAEMRTMQAMVGELQKVVTAERAVAAARAAGTTATEAQATAMATSARVMVGASTAMGLVTRATTAANMAIGAITGPIGVAVIAWQGLSLALDAFSEKKAKATDELRDFRSEIERLGPAALQAAKAFEEDAQRRLRATPPPSIGTASSRDLVSTWQANRNWNDWLTASQGRQAAIGAEIGGRETKAIVDLEKAMAGFQRQADASRASLAQFRRGGEEAVNTFKTASAAWDASAISTKSFAQALDEGDSRAIRLRDSAADAAREAAAMAKAQKAAMDALKAQRDEAERLTKVFAEMADAKKKYQEQLAGLGQKEDEQARRAIDQLAERRAAAQVTARAILDVQGREMEVVGMTTDALRTLRAEMDLKDVTDRLEALDISGPDLALFIEQWTQQRTAIDANAAAMERYRKELALIGQAAAGFSTITNAVTDLVAALGDVSPGIANALRGTSALFGNLSQAQRAGIFEDATGSHNVGFKGALAGQAGWGGQVAAVTSGLGVVSSGMSILRGVIEAVDLFGDQARERERIIKERARVFNAALDEFAIVERTSLESKLRENLSNASQLASQFGIQNPTFGSAADIASASEAYRGMSMVGRKDQRAEFRQMAEALATLSTQFQANERLIRERAAAEEALATRDLDVRRLRALGLTAEADAAQRAVEADRALEAARAQYGKDSSYVTALASVIAAEQGAAKAAQERAEAEAALTKLRQAMDFGTDLAARQQRAAGNEVGAFSIEQAATGARAIREAEDLVKAGVITIEMLEAFKIVVGQEMADAVKRMVDQMAEAKRQVEEDLRVRALVAQGLSAQAEAERVAIANRRELVDVTDAATRAAILHVQQLEAEARERARVQEIMAAHEAITKREIEALRILNPAKAAELETQQQEIDRQKELAGAADDVIRARLQELYLLEDQAAVMVKAAAAAEQATRALQEQIAAQQAAANQFRDLTAQINDEYLRATGRGFEADRLKLGETRDQRIGSVMSTGLATLGAMPTVRGPWDYEGMRALAEWQAKYAELQQQIQENVDKVNATYQANLDKLIASQMSPAGGGTSGITASGSPWSIPSAPTIPILGEDTTAVHSARSITESSAMRLVDYSAAQLAVQREILAELKGRGDRRVELLGPAAEKALADRIDRELGQRSRDSSMLVGGRIW